MRLRTSITNRNTTLEGLINIPPLSTLTPCQMRVWARKANK